MIDEDNFEILIPQQPIKDLLTPNDPFLYAKWERINWLFYDWKLEITESTNSVDKLIYKVQLISKPLIGSSNELEANLIFTITSNNARIQHNISHTGGSQVIPKCFFRPDTNVQLKIQFVKIQGFKCLPRKLENFCSPEQTVLNIGGTRFQTTKTTLTKYDGLIKMYLELESYIVSIRDTNCHLLFDRSPKHFDSILNFMRDDVLELPESDKEVRELLREANYYQMPDLIRLCSEHLESKKSSQLSTISGIITLNIGGTTFQTTKATLTRFNGMFKTMLENDILIKTNDTETIFIDRSPKHFDLILNYMRNGDVDLPESQRELREILREAQYYLLPGLAEDCRNAFNNIEI
ncbi:unnamed protein product [Caenorhabditis brenneri]